MTRSNCETPSFLVGRLVPKPPRRVEDNAPYRVLPRRVGDNAPYRLLPRRVGDNVPYRVLQRRVGDNAPYQVLQLPHKYKLPHVACRVTKKQGGEG